MVLSLILLAIALAPSPSPGQAGADPLDIRPTDLTAAQFAELAPPERQRFRDGFALGLGNTRPPANVGIRIAARLAADPPASPGAVSGADWIALDPRERLALLAGYNAGAWVAALTALTGRADDATLAGARRLVRPVPAPAPSLLAARLSDWLFYTNRRQAPMTESIAAIASQLAISSP